MAEAGCVRPTAKLEGQPSSELGCLEEMGWLWPGNIQRKEIQKERWKRQNEASLSPSQIWAKMGKNKKQVSGFDIGFERNKAPSN